MGKVTINEREVRSGLTSQLCGDGLEGQLSELRDERPQLRAGHQLVLAVVQLVGINQAVGQNRFHLHAVPTVEKDTCG